MGVDVSAVAALPRGRPLCATTAQRCRSKPDYRGEQTCAAANLVAGYQGLHLRLPGTGRLRRRLRLRRDPHRRRPGRRGLRQLHRLQGLRGRLPPEHHLDGPLQGGADAGRRLLEPRHGLDVSEVCQIGCIGCSACSKKSELMNMQDGLPVIDYQAYDEETDFSAAIEKCPRESLIYVGKPSEADLAQVADEDMPERVEADFQTTVDDTEWWG